MRKPISVDDLNEFGRERLSEHFFMRDMLYSEISNFHGIPNIPDNPDRAVEAGKWLCEELLEPLHTAFGHVSIRSAFRSAEVNDFGNKRQKEGRKGYSCAKDNDARHVWDRLDTNGRMGATACIVIPWFVDYLKNRPEMSWRAMAWWVHDHLPYSEMMFFPKYKAFNLRWSEEPLRRIDSYVEPKGCLTKPGDKNHSGDHSSEYPGFPELKRG